MELELGTLLKKARQEKGLSLDDIQEETKIRKKYLEAIEENNFDILPGNVYLKVFIKGYAREVDINYQALLENYEILNIKEEKESNLQKDYLNGTKVSNSNKNNNKKNPLKIIFIILLILFLGAAAVYTYQYVNNSEIRLLNQNNSSQENIEEESELLEVENNESTAPEAAELDNEVETGSDEASEGDRDEELEVFDDSSYENDLTADLFDSFDSDVLTEENTEIIDQNNFQELDGLNSEEQNQINEIIVSEEGDSENTDAVTEEEISDESAAESEVESGSESEVEEEATAENTQTVTEAENESAADNSAENAVNADFDNSLTFSAADTVWVTVDRDGENVFSGILENGDQQEFEVEERLYIKIGNGNAITAEINGEVYGPWAGNGEIAEVEFINEEQEFTINNLRD